LLILYMCMCVDEQVLLPHFGDRLELLFTDTDSFQMSIEYDGRADSFTRELEPLAHHFDFSNYPADHALFSEGNKMVPGKFKDETAGQPILEFVGLRPKMYSYQVVRPDGTVVDKHRSKGISRSVAESLTHKAFRDQLAVPTENLLVNRRIQSRLHQIYTVEVSKRGLCAFDDKRWLLADGISTLAFGHKDIPAVGANIPCKAQLLVLDAIECRHKRALAKAEKKRQSADGAAVARHAGVAPDPLDTVAAVGEDAGTIASVVLTRANYNTLLAISLSLSSCVDEMIQRLIRGQRPFAPVEEDDAAHEQLQRQQLHAGT